MRRPREQSLAGKRNFLIQKVPPCPGCLGAEGHFRECGLSLPGSPMPWLILS